MDIFNKQLVINKKRKKKKKKKFEKKYYKLKKMLQNFSLFAKFVQKLGNFFSGIFFIISLLLLRYNVEVTDADIMIDVMENFSEFNKALSTLRLKFVENESNHLNCQRSEEN